MFMFNGPPNDACVPFPKYPLSTLFRFSPYITSYSPLYIPQNTVRLAMREYLPDYRTSLSFPFHLSSKKFQLPSKKKKNKNTRWRLVFFVFNANLLFLFRSARLPRHPPCRGRMFGFLLLSSLPGPPVEDLTLLRILSLRIPLPCLQDQDSRQHQC